MEPKHGVAAKSLSLFRSSSSLPSFLLFFSSKFPDAMFNVGADEAIVLLYLDITAF